MYKQKRTFARALRKEMTDAERRLWHFIRRKQLKNCTFRRQFIIDPYIVDFVCLKSHLIIECDGGQHCESVYDIERDLYLKKKGYTVLRFWNIEIFQNIDGVLEMIWNHLDSP